MKLTPDRFRLFPNSLHRACDRLTGNYYSVHSCRMCCSTSNFRIGHHPAATSDEGFPARYNPSSMTVFNANVVSDQQLDWTILRDGGVALYWQPEVLAGDVNWLQSNGYTIADFD